MSSTTDIILDRQRTSLINSVAELHKVLEDDGNWRALAALESVGQAAGGVAGEAWIGRRNELIAALTGNPLFCLCNDLERLLAVVSQLIGNAETAALPEKTQAILELDTAPQAAPPQAAPPQEAMAFEPRRESIAARIATLSMTPSEPLRNAALPGDDTHLISADQDPPPVAPEADHGEPLLKISPPIEEVVSAAAQTIVAGLALARATGAAATIEGPAAGTEVREAHLETVANPELDASPLAAVAGPDDELVATEETETEIADIGAGTDQAVSGIDDLIELDSHEDNTGFDAWDDQDFEAEVSIVTRPNSAPKGATPNPPEHESVQGADGNLKETLEQRLQRLNRRPGNLLRTEVNTGTETLPVDDEAKANKWLEMIRARRAKPAVTPSLEALTPTPSPERPQFDDVVNIPPQAGNPEPDWSDPSQEPDGLEPESAVEAEVKIVQRKAPPSARPEAAAAQVAKAGHVEKTSRAPQSVLRSPRSMPLEFPAEPAVLYFGGIEEASVEIVRQPAGDKARSGEKVADLALEGTSPAAKRFIRALTGE